MRQLAQEKNKERRAVRDRKRNKLKLRTIKEDTNESGPETARSHI